MRDRCTDVPATRRAPRAESPRIHSCPHFTEEETESTQPEREGAEGGDGVPKPVRWLQSRCLFDPPKHFLWVPVVPSTYRIGHWTNINSHPALIIGLCLKTGHSIFLNLSMTRDIAHVWTPSPWARSALSGPGSREARTSAWERHGSAGCGYLGPGDPNPADRAGRPGQTVPVGGRRARRSAQSVPEHRGEACQIRGGPDAET